jgi:hypothetical protein
VSLAAATNIFAQRTTENSAQESKIAGCSAISGPGGGQLLDHTVEAGLISAAIQQF